MPPPFHSSTRWKAHFKRAIEPQISSKIRVTVLSLQMSILLILSTKKYQFLTIGRHFKKNNQIQYPVVKSRHMSESGFLHHRNERLRNKHLAFYGGGDGGGDIIVVKLQITPVVVPWAPTSSMRQ